jgi:hypothetical protein
VPSAGPFYFWMSTVIQDDLMRLGDQLGTNPRAIHLEALEFMSKLIMFYNKEETRYALHGFLGEGVCHSRW